MRKLGIIAALVATTAIAPAGASATPKCPGAHTMPARGNTKKLVRSTLCLLNVQRRKHGLRRLRLSKSLSAAARKHSRDMVHRNYFSHTSLSGASFVDRIKRTGYLSHAMAWMVGENLAWGAGSRADAAQTVRAWMHSPGHRHNILTGRFRQIGIGIVLGAPAHVGGLPSATYTTDFGFKRR